MLPPIAPAICARSVRSRPLSRSSANRHPAISRSIQAFASRAIGTSPSHRDANGRGASLFDTIDCYLRREQTMWVIASRRGSRPRRGVPMSRAGPPPRHRAGMPRAARTLSPHAFTGSAELNATVEQIAPDVLGLLADGVPRTKAAVVEALAGRHDKQDVVHALIRLAVTGRLEETGGKNTLTANEELPPAQTSHRQARPTAATSQATARARHRGDARDQPAIRVAM